MKRTTICLVVYFSSKDSSTMIKHLLKLRYCSLGIQHTSRRAFSIPVRKRTVESFTDLNFDIDSFAEIENPQSTGPSTTTLLSSQSNIRRTSGAVNEIIENKNLEVSIEEETLLELIKDLSPTPVPASEIPYVEFLDLPIAYTLPVEPKKISEDNINRYISKIVSSSYHPNLHGSVVSKLMKLVKTHATWISKESFIGIASLFHFLLKSNIAFEVLDIMQEETDIVQDVDFMNAFLMAQNGHNILKFRIKRLENSRDRKRTVNINTWYYMFNLFQSPGSKLKLLNMMLNYDVPVAPIMNKSILKLTDVLQPEELTELYTQCKIEMNPFFFNTIIRSFLFSDRIDDAWTLVQNSLKSSLVTIDTYKTFIEYFATNNQLGLCFAFDKLWTRITGVSNEYTFKSYLLNEYLTECPYFTAWSNIVKICRLNDSEEGKRKYVNVSKRANWAIHDYAIVHNVPEPSTGLGKAGKLLRDRINKDLSWPNAPIFKSEDNSTDFKETAKLLGWIEN